VQERGRHLLQLPIPGQLAVLQSIALSQQLAVLQRIAIIPLLTQPISCQPRGQQAGSAQRVLGRRHPHGGPATGVGACALARSALAAGWVNATTLPCIALVSISAIGARPQVDDWQRGILILRPSARTSLLLH